MTRPRHQAANLGRQIQIRGGIACLCPMLEIVPVESALSPNWWQGYDWLIFVSANAVRHAVAAGLRSPLSRLAAIGRATAATMEKNGLQVACQVPPPYTSESLLALPSFQQVKGCRILIVRGVGGRPKLATVLKECGAQVSLAELYRRLPPSPEMVGKLRACVQKGVDAVLVSSAQVLTNLQQAAGDLAETIHRLPLIVPSDRVAGIAGKAGFSDVTTAASAMDSEMLAALEKRLGKSSK